MIDLLRDAHFSKVSIFFLLLVIAQFPAVVWLYRAQTSSDTSAYVYNANYYKSLTAELTGHIWQAVHTRGQSSISIKLVKRAVQEFVSELQEFEEGIQDQLEYDFIIQDLSNFLQEKDGIGFSDNLIPEPSKLHNYSSEWGDCPIDPPKLIGNLRIDINISSGPDSFEETLKKSPALEKGGHWNPNYCKARSRVAIIIPYRDREEHLKYFLMYMHKILQRQELDYKIYVVNQVDDNNFNRAKLLNIGFVESLKQYDWQCFVFHDVDLVLENDKCLYRCPEMPRHLSVAIDKYKYRLPYYSIFGGITSMTVDHMITLNGYSNKYWGWGGEDDDMFARVRSANYNILRPGANLARYKMIRHLRESSNVNNPDRFRLLKNAVERMSIDGLSSLEYTVKAIHSEWTHTVIDVDLGEPEGREKQSAGGVAEVQMNFNKLISKN